jgi:hypothetical protein
MLRHLAALIVLILAVPATGETARRIDLYETAPSAGWFGIGADGASEPTRRVRQSDLRSVGTIPVPHRAEVETPSAGTQTVVTFTHVAFDQGLPDELFNQPALEWGAIVHARDSRARVRPPRAACSQPRVRRRGRVTACRVRRTAPATSAGREMPAR